ncbi:MAG: nitroreductase/quinone reductase family protein [Ilumatobacter sp.]|uniref:nitroreductase/quinone reductase family protein n=1 Tax=Ilumatobacter sp. TaxID=1967498 RepID=UPI002618D5D3|nr:nitroreductase/quinone reductase family protein [Ilumatobacter sp.]MDJ0768043.1 nitroreductase/quinone reductase family protein [Ilumatobacter sp.]
MGLLDELGYTVKPANAVQRVTQRIASSRPGAWTFQRTLYPMDKALFRISKGRTTVPGLLAGLPVIMLTTTGAKSGRSRTMPLLGIPLDGALAVIGSNYGQQHTPGWVYNLEADPAASVGYRDRTVAVVARRASDEGADRAFDLAADVYPGYAKYRERADHRVIRVFVLEPAD